MAAEFGTGAKAVEFTAMGVRELTPPNGIHWIQIDVVGAPDASMLSGSFHWPHPPGGRVIERHFDVVCLSHLRWDWVWQRPNPLLSRCARSHRVFSVEEPIEDAETRIEVT